MEAADKLAKGYRFDLAMPVLGAHPKDPKIFYRRHTRPSMFPAAIFMVERNGLILDAHQSIYGQEKHRVSTQKSFSSVKKNKSMSFARK